MENIVRADNTGAARGLWFDRAHFLRAVEEVLDLTLARKADLSLVVLSMAFTNRGAETSIVEFVQSSLRPGDFAARFDGATYVLALPSTGRQGAAVVAGRLRRVVIDFGPSVAVVTAPADGDTVKQVLAVARKA